MTIDFGRTAGDYGRYRAGYPPEIFDRLGALGIGRPGQRVLDIGTGTGFFGRGLALRGAEVTGLDPSEALIAEARRLDREAGVVVSYVAGKAEDTGLATGSFDVVSAAQCWHWFDAARAAAEARRLLVPGGWLVIAHYDWLPLAGNVVEATERLILQHNPAWRGAGGTGMHPEHLGAVAGAGFEEMKIFFFEEPAIYSHEAWRGRIRASAGVGASLSPEKVAAFDVELAALLRERFPEEPLAVPHRAWALIGRAPV